MSADTKHVLWVTDAWRREVSPIVFAMINVHRLKRQDLFAPKVVLTTICASYADKFVRNDATSWLRNTENAVSKRSVVLFYKRKIKVGFGKVYEDFFTRYLSCTCVM